MKSSLSALKTSRAAAVVLLAVLGLLPLSPIHADPPPPPLEVPVSRDWLFMPQRDVSMQAAHSHGGLSAQQIGPTHWNITGALTDGVGGIRFTPPEGTRSWDFTDYSLFTLRITNDGPGTVWVEARLENGGAVDWANNAMSQSYILPGDTGFVTVGYPHGGRDDAPPQFAQMAAKPNGWRSHWKAFNPGDITSLRLLVRSSHPDIRLTNVEPYLSWPYGSEANADLVALPYIDRFGQAIPFAWPMRVEREVSLEARALMEQDQHAGDQGPAAFDTFGGYADGPQLEATGYFRTEKVDGRWWLVDPEGRLFWSHGACSVANSSPTGIAGPRRELFEWIPEPGSPEYAAGFTNNPQHGPRVDFLRINTLRKYGENWEQASLDTTHQRMRWWGMNTLAAWSDTDLFDQQRTPYTEIVHIWHGPHSIDGICDPYEEAYETRVREAVQAVAERRRDDPWMIGLFIDNEVHWHNDMIERIIQRTNRHPVYGALVSMLQQRYDSIEALNAAWGTNAAGWDALVPGRTDAWRADADAFYAQLAERYYSVCREAMDELLPNHLYLGSRVHRCPPVVAQQIARFVDVYSINHYGPVAGAGTLPADADLPVMVTEFHFGTIDRGVLGMSLCPVHDQTQRARSYAAYVTAGLLNPNIVGTHWFAFADQHTAGRPGENYQIGMIDITDTPYPELTAMTRALGERMYQMRLSDDAALLEEVEALIRAAEDSE